MKYSFSSKYEVLLLDRLELCREIKSSNNYLIDSEIRIRCMEMSLYRTIYSGKGMEMCMMS